MHRVIVIGCYEICLGVVCYRIAKQGHVTLSALFIHTHVHTDTGHGLEDIQQHKGWSLLPRRIFAHCEAGFDLITWKKEGERAPHHQARHIPHCY